MGKKRRRSEVSGSDPEEYDSRKRKCKEKWTVAEAVNKQTSLCNQLYEFLRKYKDSNKHCLGEFLIRAPSRRLQPNYYEVISHPIDMMRIQQKLKTDDYRTVSDFLADIRLLLDNALTYYDESTEEHHNAVELERVFTWKLRDAGLGVDSDSDSLQSPTSLTLKIPKSQLLTPTGETTPKSVKPALKTGSSSSIRPPLRLKLTRSKAWLEDYLSSDEPIKIYFASVYNYHDPLGEYVAEVFHDLPDRHDYPEYYHVISEPIDLNMIRRNVEVGHYLNLKTIQDDLLLMIKNAHYFNEPGSGVYKSASSLRKVIISKCSDLERRYQTVVKTVPPKLSVQFPDDTGSTGPGRDGKKVPVLKLRSTGDYFTSRRLSKSSSEMEDESQTETSEDEEGLSSNEEGGGKLMLKIKKDKLMSDVEPVSKLLHMKKLPSLKRRLLAIYRSLTSKTDSSGRVLCELFMRRPSSKLYPEYYIVIKQPIDLREILQNIRGETYSSLEEMVYDVDLMAENACTFNEEESMVYKDALVLKEVANDALKKLATGWTDPITAQRGRPRKLSETGTQGATPTSTGMDVLDQLVTKHPTMADCVTLFKAVKAISGPNGRLLWLSFKQAPSQGASDYHSTVKKPMDFQTIESKLTSCQYSNLDQLMDDIALLCDNAYGYYHRGSGESKDALLILRAVVKKYSELKAVERAEKPMVDVKKCVQKLLVEIVTRVFDYKDSTNRHLIGTLKGLTFSKDFHQVNSEEEAVIKHPFNLHRIKQFTHQRRYSRLSQLQDDLLTVFKLGREKYGSKIYRDSIEFERLYLRVRDEVCKGGDVLWSSALDYTVTQLEEELATRVKTHFKSPSPPPSVLSTSSSSSTSLTSPASERGVSEDPEEKEENEGLELLEKTSQEFFRELEYDDVMYHVGDVVYVTPVSDSGGPVGTKKPHVVLIEKLWTDSSESKWLNGCWFYRPEETFHVATKKFYVREVFKSDFHGLAKFSRVVGKCCVLPVKDYIKYEPEGYQEEDVYVCESRYSFKAKSFRRIKSWNLLGQQPTLKVRETPASLTKVPSVFAPAVSTSTPGKSEPEKMEVDEKLEISEDLDLMLCENVVTSVPNPEQGHTYYEQYCIDSDYFRLGDFVYLRSDQEQPFIARIERMWTDSNGDPWIRGPWFIRPSEVAHNPTRLFYEKELFMSNIQDTNPMRSISGKCSVMFISDYTKKRPTEFSEGDVYIVECRYNEGEKEIRRTKGIKQFLLSKSSIGDEIYCFPKELQLLRVASPKLQSKDFDPPSDTSSNKKLSLIQATPTCTTPIATPTNLPAQLANFLKVASSGGGQSKTAINLNPQMLQQLLSTAAQLSTTRPVVIPLQQSALTSLAGSSSKSPATPSTPKSATTPTVTTPISPALYTCQWDGCGKVFQNAADLSNHLLLIPTPGNMGMGHIIKTGSGYYCHWKNCPRNPLFEGRPFDALPKITRHLKEVHLMKLSNTALGFNIKSSPVVSTPSTPVLPTSTTPSTPVLSLIQPVRSVTQAITQQPTTQLVQPPKECVIEMEDSASSQVGKSQLPRIFLPPPENRQKLVHSEIYKKYIRQVQSNSSYMSSLQDATEIRASRNPVPPNPLRPGDWLAPGAIEKTDSASVVDALWALRDHMLQDSCRLAELLERYQ